MGELNATCLAYNTGSNAGGTIDDAVRSAESLGFQAVTFYGGRGYFVANEVAARETLGFHWDELNGEQREQLISIRGRILRAGMHAPIVETPLVCNNLEVEKLTMQYYGGCMRAAGALRLENVTVHVVPRAYTTETDFMTRLVHNLRRLGDLAQENGTTIGVENVYYPTTPTEHVELLERVDHPAVGATLDVGHIKFWFAKDGLLRLPPEDGAAWYNERLLRHLDALGGRIVHMHVHDVVLPAVMDHHPAGRGVIDFAAVFARLRRLNYGGLLELEIAPQADGDASVKFAYDHLLARLGGVEPRAAVAAGAAAAS